VAGLTGIDHQLAEASVADQPILARLLQELSLAAVCDLDARFATQDRLPASQNQELDCVVSFSLKAERTLDIPLSKLSQDLDRRIRNREIREESRTALPFLQEHRLRITKLWREQREQWFRKRYEVKTGKPAPDEFIVKNPVMVGASRTVPSGWQMKDEVRRIFDPRDHRDFRADMERLYRQQQGLPAKGEGWLQQTYLAKCVRGVLAGYEIVLEARPRWLGHQRLDMFVPTLNLAIEYQGEQHYLPLDHLGAEQGLRDRQALDKAKREACERAGVHLIEWHYLTPISVKSVRAALAAVGIRTSEKA
jgi:hypothetical protein